MWVHFHNNEVSALERCCSGLLHSISQLLRVEKPANTQACTLGYLVPALATIHTS